MQLPLQDLANETCRIKHMKDRLQLVCAHPLSYLLIRKCRASKSETLKMLVGSRPTASSPGCPVRKEVVCRLQVVV